MSRVFPSSLVATTSSGGGRGGGVVVVVVVVSEDSLGYGSLPSMLFERGFLVHNVRQAS